MDTPLVSVVIPTYKRPHLLEKAVRSVLEQHVDAMEVLIVDDSRTEPVAPYIRTLDPRIRYIPPLEEPRGGAGTRNAGIAEATGRYVAFLDDDDTWFPGKLEAQLEALQGAPSDVAFCFTAVDQLRDHGVRYQSQIQGGVVDRTVASLVQFNDTITSTLLIKRAVLKEVGGFDASLPSHQEAELLIRVSQKYRGLGIPNPYVQMLFESTHQHVNSDLTKRIRGREMVLEKHHDLYAKHTDIRARHAFQIAVWYRDSGDTVQAKKWFTCSLHDQFSLRTLAHLGLTYLRGAAHHVSDK